VQTLAAFFLSRKIDLPPAEQRLIEVEPGIPVLCHCHWQKDRRALTLIVVHGLEGSSESQYMLGVARNGLAAGMNVVRMNQRNCGGMDHCAPTLYNSSRSADVAAVVGNLVERDRIPGFVLIGFSMGGNLVLKLAGEWGSDAPAEFRGVAASGGARGSHGEPDADASSRARGGRRSVSLRWQAVFLKKRFILGCDVRMGDGREGRAFDIPKNNAE